MICPIHIRKLQRSAITGPTGAARSIRIDAPASIAIYDRVFASQETQVPRSYNASQCAAGNSTIYPLDRFIMPGPRARLPDGSPSTWRDPNALARANSGRSARRSKCVRRWQSPLPDLPLGNDGSDPLRAVDQMVITSNSVVRALRYARGRTNRRQPGGRR